MTKTDKRTDPIGGPPAAIASTVSPLLANVRLPQSLRRVLPRVLTSALREFRVRILMRSFAGGTLGYTEAVLSDADAAAGKAMSIIVPVHDAPIVTKRCLTSLEKFAPYAEIILVDDASKLPETRNIIEDYIHRGGWKHIRNEEPLGHSAASNAGARLATRPYLCLLNSDTVVTPWCWRLIKDVFELHEDVAVVGPSTSAAATVQALPIAIHLKSQWDDSQIYRFAEELLTEPARQLVKDLEWAAGFAFFIRRSVWERLDGFDESFPDYGNELELCKRVANAGYRRVWIQNAYIHHLGGQSYGSAIGEKEMIARKKAASLRIQSS